MSNGGRRPIAAVRNDRMRTGMPVSSRLKARRDMPYRTPRWIASAETGNADRHRHGVRLAEIVHVEFEQRVCVRRFEPGSFATTSRAALPAAAMRAFSAATSSPSSMPR